MKKLAAFAVGAMLLIVVAVAVAMTVGGVSMVRTRGISMEPGFVAGDLAVLRPATHYAVGDVATYHSDDMDTAVMHRVVGIDGDVFTFQGDNNDWLDPEHPTRDQLIGKLALKVPQGGLWLDRATSPAALAAVAFLLLTGGTTAATGPRRRRRRQEQRENSTSRAGTRTKFPLPTPVAVVAAVAAVLAVGAGGLMLFAGSLPAERERVAVAAEGATMTFSYQATVAESAAYDSTTVKQPQPIFRKLADEADVTFVYRGPAVSNATVNVNAVMTTSNGWRSTMSLADDSSFSGTTYQGNVRVRIPDLQAKANAAATAIGAGQSGDVSVLVVPEVSSDDLTFRAELPFLLDGVALRLANGDTTPLVVDHAPVPAAAPGPSAPAVLGHRITTGTARQAALGALLLAVALAVGAGVVARKHWAAPEDVSIQHRFGSLLLAVEPVALPPGRAVIEVPDIEGLARLADRYGLYILHWVRGDVHTYVVFEDNTTYRFSTGADDNDLTASAEAPATPADGKWLHAAS